MPIIVSSLDSPTATPLVGANLLHVACYGVVLELGHKNEQNKPVMRCFEIADHVEPAT